MTSPRSLSFLQSQVWSEKLGLGIRAVGGAHAAVAHTSPVGLDAVLDAERLIDRQLVLVVPKPNSRPMNQLRQLPRRNLIPTPKRGVRPVMRQQNQSAFVS